MKIQVDKMTFLELGRVAKLLSSYKTRITKIADSTYLEFEKAGYMQGQTSAFQESVCNLAPQASLLSVERISF